MLFMLEARIVIGQLQEQEPARGFRALIGEQKMYATLTAELQNSAASYTAGDDDVQDDGAVQAAVELALARDPRAFFDGHHVVLAH